MKPVVQIEDATGSRRVEANELPLAIGGAQADLRLAGSSSPEPLAWIGVSDDRPFVQAAEGGRVSCNGAPVATSQWLHDGDEIRVDSTRIGVKIDRDGIRLILDAIVADEITEPPEIATRESATGPDTTVRPVVFEPRSI